MSKLKDKAELERLLFQYIERYGLTEEARRYFAQQEVLREHVQNRNDLTHGS